MPCLYIKISQLLMGLFENGKKGLIAKSPVPLSSAISSKNLAFKVTRPLVEKAGRWPKKDGYKNKNTATHKLPYNFFGVNFFVASL